MLYSEIIAVCSQIPTKYINTVCGQNVAFWMLAKQRGQFSLFQSFRGTSVCSLLEIPSSRCVTSHTLLQCRHSASCGMKQQTELLQFCRLLLAHPITDTLCSVHLPQLAGSLNALCRLVSLQQLRRFVVDLSQQRSGFDPRPVHVRFLLHKATLGQVFPLGIRLFAISIIP